MFVARCLCLFFSFFLFLFLVLRDWERVRAHLLSVWSLFTIYFWLDGAYFVPIFLTKGIKSFYNSVCIDVGEESNNFWKLWRLFQKERKAQGSQHPSYIFHIQNLGIFDCHASPLPQRLLKLPRMKVMLWNTRRFPTMIAVQRTCIIFMPLFFSLFFNFFNFFWNVYTRDEAPKSEE